MVLTLTPVTKVFHLVSFGIQLHEVVNQDLAGQKIQCTQICNFTLMSADHHLAVDNNCLSRPELWCTSGNSNLSPGWGHPEFLPQGRDLNLEGGFVLPVAGLQLRASCLQAVFGVTLYNQGCDDGFSVLCLGKSWVSRVFGSGSLACREEYDPYNFVRINRGRPFAGSFRLMRCRRPFLRDTNYIDLPRENK